MCLGEQRRCELVKSTKNDAGRNAPDELGNATIGKQGLCSCELRALHLQKRTREIESDISVCQGKTNVSQPSIDDT